MLVINSVQGEAVLTKYLGRKGLKMPIDFEIVFLIYNKVIRPVQFIINYYAKEFCVS